MLVSPIQAANLAVNFYTSNGIEVPNNWRWNHDLYHTLSGFGISNQGEVSVYCLMTMVEDECTPSYEECLKQWNYNLENFCPDSGKFSQELYEFIIACCKTKVHIIKEITPEWYQSFITEFDNLVQ